MSVGPQRTDLPTTGTQANGDAPRRPAFERLLVSLCTGFVNVPADGLDAGIHAALRQIGEYAGVDRCFIYTFDKGVQHASLTHEWVGPGVRSVRESMQGVSTAPFTAWVEQLIANRSVYVPDVGRLPAHAAALRELYDRLGVKSAVNAAMMRGTELIGLLGFASVHQPRAWRREEIDAAHVLAEVLVNTLERQRAERLVRESEERLRLTSECVEDGLFDWDIRADRLYVSDYTLRAFGLPEGDNWRDPARWRALIHPDDAQQVQAALDAHLAGAAPMYEAEYRMARPGGGYGWRHARGRVVEHDAAGGPLRMLGVDRDVTDRVEQRDRLRQLETQLVHLGRIAAMGETVAGIAHEVNQPLHAAATFCAAAGRALASGRPDALAKGAELYQKVADQVTRAGDIIRRLREFTRPQPPKFAPVDVNVIVREAALLVGQLAAPAGVRLEFDFDESLPRVLGDAVQLQQVVVNLLQNADDALREHPPAEPAIVLSTRVESGGGGDGDSQAVVRVCDNAATPPAEHAAGPPDGLFEPFFTTKADGMGIGLALCRTILKTHRGGIHASHNAGGGMTFAFTLPIDPAGADSAVFSCIAIPPPGAQGTPQ
ncbi:MAG: PAS domain-containing protein [Planctomycetota bacterium]